MEENYQGYNQPEYENDDPRKGANKSILGYRIVIIILAVILAAITVLYYNIHRQQQADYDLLVIDRDSIQNNLSDLMQDFDDLQLSNDTLSLQMGIERQRADSLMQRLKQERSWSLAKIKQYEKEVGTLRTIMRGYLHQIDSLNTLNKKLIDENVSYRKEITTAQMRAEMAEEKAQELNNKVRQGSVINARGIRMVALNARSKEVSRIKNAERLRVDFTLTANALATPGEKTIYVRILSPDGYVLSSESVPTFEFEGERLSYSASRDVDYQNEDLNIGIFYTGSGFRRYLPGTDLLRRVPDRLDRAADAINKASSDPDNRKRPALQGRTLSVTEWFATIFTPGIRNDPCKNHSFQIRAEAPRIAAFWAGMPLGSTFTLPR
jgi:cell division protein FtsL